MIENILTLSNGVSLPHVGLGTYPMVGEELQNAILAAYKAGYRLIDTADNYYNETSLGNILQFLYKQTDANREKMFLVSKVSDELYEPGTLGGGRNKGKYFWKTSSIMMKPNAVHHVVRKKISDTLKNLQTDYLDLYLMHWPYPDFLLEIWYEMELLYKEGLVRAIGVCNCRERHLRKIEDNCSICPMVNQFETSPLNTKSALVAYCNQHNITVMVYSPLMSLRRKEYKEYLQYLDTLGEKYNRTAAQVIIRFDVQRGLVPIPKSSHDDRLNNNFSVFDFSLSQQEMKKLYSFNIDLQYLPESISCPGL